MYDTFILYVLVGSTGEKPQMFKKLAATTVAVIALSSAAHARATDINSCTTIAKPGSYVLAGDIVYSGSAYGTCIKITTSRVSIDLEGHTISWPGPQSPGAAPVAIESAENTEHVTVENGIISGFGSGVDLAGSGSTVKDIHVGGPCPCQGDGIVANGVVEDNVVSVQSAPDFSIGIHVAGVAKGNYIYDTRSTGMLVDADSTVTGNTITGTFGLPGYGMAVSCPSTVAHNTITGSTGKNLVLNGAGCTVKDNTAP
jgi:putative cofactor-binding repeat protein